MIKQRHEIAPDGCHPASVVNSSVVHYPMLLGGTTFCAGRVVDTDVYTDDITEITCPGCRVNFLNGEIIVAMFDALKGTEQYAAAANAAKAADAKWRACFKAAEEARSQQSR